MKHIYQLKINGKIVIFNTESRISISNVVSTFWVNLNLKIVHQQGLYQPSFSPYCLKILYNCQIRYIFLMTNGLVFDVSEFKKLGHEKQRLISSLLFSSIAKEIHQHFSHKNPVVWTAEDYFIANVVLLTILKFHLFLYHYFVFFGCMFSSMYL